MGARILIWGAGAIGGTVGAFLGAAGHDITFVDTDAAHVAAIRARGAEDQRPNRHLGGPGPGFPAG